MEPREDAIFRLAKPKRKGLLSLLFSRLLIIVLLMALQLVVLDALFVWLKQYLHWISLLQGLFTAAMVIYLFNSNMDSSARLTWMFLIALFPLPAAARPLTCYVSGVAAGTWTVSVADATHAVSATEFGGLLTFSVPATAASGSVPAAVTVTLTPA